MTNQEKLELARQREREELQKILQDFERTVAEAQRQAAEIRQWADRNKRIDEEAKLDRQIDELDYMMKRGKYAHLRVVK